MRGDDSENSSPYNNDKGRKSILKGSERHRNSIVSASQIDVVQENRPEFMPRSESEDEVELFDHQSSDRSSMSTARRMVSTKVFPMVMQEGLHDDGITPSKNRPSNTQTQSRSLMQSSQNRMSVEESKQAMLINDFTQSQQKENEPPSR